jgi:predicted Zn finger-like uncharacterized protein
MLIVCPNCATTYMVEPETVGPSGRSVRCARCKATWFADTGAESAPVAAGAEQAAAEPDKQATSAPRPVMPETVDKMPVTDPAAPADEADAATEAPVAAGEPSLPDEPQAPGDTPTEPVESIPEPVAVSDAPTLVPSVEAEPLPEAEHVEAEAEDAESFAARRERLHKRRVRSYRSSRWTAIILLLFAFNVAVVGARSEVVRYFPQTASLFAAIGLPVNLRHLQFKDVRIAKDGNGMLVVKGTIVSTASEPINIPRLRFAARNAAGQEVYTWTAQPSRKVLDPGGTLDFSSQLASPPDDAVNVMVRFLTREDVTGGEK